MGDAYTAVATDASTLFYNPAALGRNTQVSIHMMNPKIGATNYLKYSDKLSDFPSDAADIATSIMGIPLYFSLGANPTIKMKYFALTLFANAKTSLVIENAVHPSLEIDYRLDRGFIAGFGFPLSGSGKPGGNGLLTTLGFSLKGFNRQGLSNSFDLFGTELLEVISNSSGVEEIRKNLGYSTSKTAWGVDMGMEQSYFSGATSHVLGVSLLDVFDTQFKKISGAHTIPKQKMNMNIGYAFSQKWMIFDYTLSADLHPVLEPIAFLSKFHLGAKVGLPFFDVYAGWNAGYISYGAAMDIMFMRLTIGLYGVEVGSTYKERSAERAIIALDLLSMDFEI